MDLSCMTGQSLILGIFIPWHLARHHTLSESWVVQLAAPKDPIVLQFVRYRSGIYYIVDVFLYDDQEVITLVAVDLKVRQHRIRALKIQDTSSDTKCPLNQVQGPPNLLAAMLSGNFYVRTQDGCLIKQNQLSVCMSTLAPLAYPPLS
jgi:hypothetical protein